MKTWQSLASLSRAVLSVSHSSRKIDAARANVTQRRLSSNGVSDSLNYLTTVAKGGDKAAQEEFSNAKTSVWWDLENCQVPKGCDGLKIAKNIEFALREHNYRGSFAIHAYGNTNQMPSPVQDALSSTGISLNHVPSGKKDRSDMMIIVDMLLWAEKNRAPANIMLISGDGDFSYVLNKLRMKNYNIILVRPEKASSPILVSAAKTVLLWTSIVGSEDPKRVQPSKKSPMLCKISSKKHKKKVPQVAKSNQKDWLCSICQVSVPKGCYEGHISGRRHKNKLKVQAGASC